jgi:hypothetical protein
VSVGLTRRPASAHSALPPAFPLFPTRPTSSVRSTCLSALYSRLKTWPRRAEAGPGWVTTDLDGRCSVCLVINAAGLYADTVAHWFGVGEEYRMLPFKGLYWSGS